MQITNYRIRELHLMIRYNILKDKKIVINKCSANYENANMMTKEEEIALLEQIAFDQKEIAYGNEFDCNCVINDDVLTFHYSKSSRPPLTNEQHQEAFKQIENWK